MGLIGPKVTFWTTLQNRKPQMPSSELFSVQALIMLIMSEPPWRNRLARSAVNRKVGGSSPPGGEHSFWKISFMNDFERFAFCWSNLQILKWKFSAPCGRVSNDKLIRNKKWNWGMFEQGQYPSKESSCYKMKKLSEAINETFIFIHSSCLEWLLHWFAFSWAAMRVCRPG